ncbi:hypothetical protein TTHERM_00227100 (macronuclear) [Tetrahymena thermophila SB210]|uniref:Uncharacterized protein n=1 Tax=Tetrahymena thermophila (strain SB210) TaxID=312017 RepID=Q23BX2_TETTS|nr:hypothetical protein TTHERM_00227100 [Tetrahymena thermophila SB210]EAR93996.2 hypothetical protein TTHERM_00227100 [Tetrahymena thermophila SB210]|eukprot:XP_001014241.2 hypothetical protein TTHERM_00227100 [Tetrahymena thermophila SB210]
MAQVKKSNNQYFFLVIIQQIKYQLDRILKDICKKYQIYFLIFISKMNWQSAYIRYQFDQMSSEIEEEEKIDQNKVNKKPLQFMTQCLNSLQDSQPDLECFQDLGQLDQKEKGDFSMILDSIKQYVNNNEQNLDSSSYQNHDESFQILRNFGEISQYKYIKTKWQKKEEVKKNQQVLDEDLNLVKKENDQLIFNYCLLLEQNPQKESTLSKNQIFFQDKKQYCEYMIDKLILDQMRKIKMELKRFLYGSQNNESYRDQTFESIRELDYKILFMKFTQFGFTVNIVTKQQQGLNSQTPQLTKENLIIFLNKNKKMLFTGTVLFSSEYIDKQHKHPEAFQNLDETIFEENADKIAQATDKQDEESKNEKNKNQQSDKQEYFSQIKLNINQSNATEVLQQLIDPKNLVVFEVQNKWKPFKCNFLALKYMLDDPNDVSFSDEIIKGQIQNLAFEQFRKIKSKYFQNNPNYGFFQNLNKHIYFDRLLNFIDELKDQNMLSSSQLDCLKYVLTQKIALVQSIQGKQKCQIQFETIKILYQTYSKQENKKPILIICQQNETLNQYLEYLSKLQNYLDSTNKDKKNQNKIHFLRLGNVGKVNYNKYQKHLLPNDLRNPISNNKIDDLNKQLQHQTKYHKMANRKLGYKELNSFEKEFNQQANSQQFQKIFFSDKITNLLISQYFTDLSDEQKQRIKEEKNQILKLWINLDLNSNNLENLIQIELTKGQKKLIDYYLGLLISQRQQYNKLYQSNYYRHSDINPIIFNLQEQQLDNSPQSFAEFINGFERLSQITFYHMMSIKDYIIYFYKFEIFESFKYLNSIFNSETENNAKIQTVQQLQYFRQQDVILTTVNYSHTYSLVFKMLQPEIIIIDEAASIQHEYLIANVLFYQPKHLIQFGNNIQLNLVNKDQVLKVKNQTMNAQFWRLIRVKIPFYKTILMQQVSLDLYLLANLIMDVGFVDDEGEIQKSLYRLQEELNDNELQKNQKLSIYVNNFDIQQTYIIIRESDSVFIVCNKQRTDFRFFNQLELLAQITFQFHQSVIKNNIKHVKLQLNPFHYFLDYDKIDENDLKITLNDQEILVENSLNKHQKFIQESTEHQRSLDISNQQTISTCFSTSQILENQAQQIQLNSDKIKQNMLNVESYNSNNNPQKSQQTQQGRKYKIVYERKSNNINERKQNNIDERKSNNMYDILNQSQILEEKYEKQQVFNKAIKNINLIISQEQTDLHKILIKIEKYLRQLINYIDDAEKIDYYEERMDYVILMLIHNYPDIDLFYQNLKGSVDQNDQFQLKSLIILQQDILIKQLKFRMQAQQNNQENDKQNQISDQKQIQQITNLINLLRKRIFKNNQRLIEVLDLIKDYSSQILDLEWILIQILFKETQSLQNNDVQLIGQINSKIKNFKFKVASQKSNTSFSEFQFQFFKENDEEIQLQKVQELNKILINTLQQQYKNYIIILAKTQNSWVLKKIQIQKDFTQKFEEQCSNIFIFVKQKLQNQKNNMTTQQINKQNSIKPNLRSKLLNSLKTISYIYNS